ncbi:glycoside hydrolase family 2 protein [Labilibacter marinus]|uniref:glycoside hydrolase family 2 protein n=1 Tax=Labilibacter marinus TaxID=1477105 RepID=UPI000950296F|nr:sugar-binding domain-containing protein [Labilibacter marinus]
MKHNVQLSFKMVIALLVMWAIQENKLNSQNFSTAGFYEVKDGARKVYNFNQGWRFYKGDAKGAEAFEFDDSQWEAANLPHGLEILPENASGGRNYQGIAWYRKKFEVPNIDQRTLMYFEGVMGKAELWVNGKKVTEHFGGYLPFAADITELINKEGANFVAVKADNSDSKLYPPGKIQGGLDFTYFGGIYRDAFLIQTSNVCVTLPELSSRVAGGGVFVATLDVDGKNAKMIARTEIKNNASTTQNIVVKSTLENAEQKALQSFTQKAKVKAGASFQLEKKFEAKNVHLWHPDDPYLHYLKTEIIVNGKVVDELRTRVGIRLFQMRGSKGLFVNKEPYKEKIIGCNRHQDYTFVGNALPNSGQWRDVKLLREGGSRIIRVGHYPQDPAFYDACDELGMFTTTANPGWHFYNNEQPIFEQRLYEDTRNLVRAGRNYASILMWETALNETPYQPGHAMNNMHKAAHEEFPFPGMYTVTDYHEAVKGGLDMHYHGHDSTVCSFNREYGDGGEVDNWHSQNATTRVKIEWGEKAMLEQALIQAEVLNNRYPTPTFRIGGAKWAGIDHQRGYHPDPFWGGFLNGLRIPKYVYHLYKSQYDINYKVSGIKTGPMMYVCHELTQVSPSDVVVFSNCDEIRITWLDEVLSTQKPSTDSKYSSLPHPPFIFKNVFDFGVIKTEWRNKIPEVKMIVEGLIDGQVVLREERDYPEQSVGLALSVSDEGMSLTAGGSDFIPVRATVVDGKGNKKVLASEYVLFQVEGPAEIIGGNANQGNPIKTEFGVATALIRATGEAGEIKVTAHSNGLKSGEVIFSSFACKDKVLLDKRYAETSMKPSAETSVIIQKERSDLPMDVQELQKEVKQLRLDIVGKEQEVMELRSRLKK